MDNALDKFKQRKDDLRDWIKADTRHSDQKHLDDGTAERLYWHTGYVSALSDVLEFLGYNKEQQ